MWFGSSLSSIRRQIWLIAFSFVVLLPGCSGSPGPSQVAEHDVTPSTAKAAPRLPSDGYDLAREERRGGHTLARHVARTDEQLHERLQRERNVSAASTWTDLQTAEGTLAETLPAERGRIESWTRRGERRPNLVLHFEAGHPIGRSLKRDRSEVVTFTSAGIVLRADGPDSFYVLTTDPEARE